MEREIKFRRFAKRANEMVYNGGDYLENFFRIIDNDRSSNESNYIVMQYTGLKDKNGKEIYEGDIVKHDNGIESAILKVEWGGQWKSCGFVLTGTQPFKNERVEFSSDNLNFNWEDGCLEIIGNIYENPELLTNK